MKWLRQPEGGRPGQNEDKNYPIERAASEGFLSWDENGGEPLRPFTIPFSGPPDQKQVADEEHPDRERKCERHPAKKGYRLDR